MITVVVKCNIIGDMKCEKVTRRFRVQKEKNPFSHLKLLTKTGIQLTYYHQRQVDNKIKEKAKSNQDQDKGDP